MPATERTCSNCIYYKVNGDDEDCHRYPPAAKQVWGGTTADSWCGEWAPDFSLPFYPGPVA